MYASVRPLGEIASGLRGSPGAACLPSEVGPHGAARELTAVPGRLSLRRRIRRSPGCAAAGRLPRRDRPAARAPRADGSTQSTRALDPARAASDPRPASCRGFPPGPTARPRDSDFQGRRAQVEEPGADSQLRSRLRDLSAGTCLARACRSAEVATGLRTWSGILSQAERDRGIMETRSPVPAPWSPPRSRTRHTRELPSLLQGPPH